MIKGINRQILEVSNTESPYFEKILFFVRPEQGASESRLKKEAQSLADNMKKPPRFKKTAAQRFKTGAFIALGAGAGAAITYLMGVIA